MVCAAASRSSTDALRGESTGVTTTLAEQGKKNLGEFRDRFVFQAAENQRQRLAVVQMRYRSTQRPCPGRIVANVQQHICPAAIAGNVLQACRPNRIANAGLNIDGQ